MVDNCQHVLLRCCVNLLDLYRRLGVEEKIRFYREFRFIEPGGGIGDAARHSAGARPFRRLVSRAEISRASRTRSRSRAACWRSRRAQDPRGSRPDLHAGVAREKRQTPRAIERYWRQVLVSAVNEELDRMAASHGFQVFWLGMMARADSYEMGIPDVPLRELYDERSLGRPGREIHPRSAVTAIEMRRGAWPPIQTGGGRAQADYYVSCLPFERLKPLMPDLPDRMGRVRALADYRHSSLVRPAHHRSAARHAARPHHSVVLQ